MTTHHCKNFFYVLGAEESPTCHSKPKLIVSMGTNFQPPQLRIVGIYNHKKLTSNKTRPLYSHNQVLFHILTSFTDSGLSHLAFTHYTTALLVYFLPC